MKIQHQQYVVENLGKKSIRQIAQELHLQEREIRKFLKTQKTKKQPAAISSAQPPFLRTKQIPLALSIILIIIVGFLTYSNSFKGEFVYDDHMLIVDNLHIKDWAHLPKLLTEDVGQGAQYEYRFYRPLQALSYMLDYSFWKLNPFGYHLTNIILHIFVSICIYWLILLLFHDTYLSLLTTLLFIVHPVHTEAIAYISGRTDPLAALFLLLSVIMYIKYVTMHKKYLFPLTLIFYIFALLSRENVLIAPAIVLLYHYVFKKKIKPVPFFSLLGIFCGYLIARFSLLSSLFPHLSSTTTLAERIPGFFIAFISYIRLLLMPFNLHMEYGEKVFSFTDPMSIFGMLFLALIIFYALRMRTRNPLIFFGMSWYMLTLLPSANLYPINAYMAEHWLYLPSIGVFLIAAHGICFLYFEKKLKITVAIFFSALMIFYASRTIQQNEYWKNHQVFYERTMHYEPQSPRMYDNLGTLYAGKGKYGEAIPLFTKSIELKPDNMQAYNNLGAAYHYLHDYKNAIAVLKKALEIDPKYADTYVHLGAVYIALEKYNEALEFLIKAIALRPDDAKAYNNLGLAYQYLNKYEAAEGAFKKALEINPNETKVYLNLGALYETMGRQNDAMVLFKKAIELSPDSPSVHFDLGGMYYRMNKYQDALREFEKVIKKDPTNAAAHSNLAKTYYYVKRYESAVTAYDKALELGAESDTEFLKAIEPYRKKP